VAVARLRPFFGQHIDLSQAVRIFGHDEIRLLAAAIQLYSYVSAVCILGQAAQPQAEEGMAKQ
jgi:hypothetical protein